MDYSTNNKCNTFIAMATVVVLSGLPSMGKSIPSVWPAQAHVQTEVGGNATLTCLHNISNSDYEVRFNLISLGRTVKLFNYSTTSDSGEVLHPSFSKRISYKRAPQAFSLTLSEVTAKDEGAFQCIFTGDNWQQEASIAFNTYVRANDTFISNQQSRSRGNDPRGITGAGVGGLIGYLAVILFGVLVVYKWKTRNKGAENERPTDKV